MMGRPRLAGMLAELGSFREASGLIAEQLAHAGIADAGIEARALLRALSLPGDMRLETFLNERLAEHPALLARLTDMALKRIDRMPLDRIIGRRGFWTLDFMLTPATLSPRADTETLVDAALRFARSGERAGKQDWRIADLGTGSGAILLALLAELPLAMGVGIDLSEAAVAAARTNLDHALALHPELAGRATFRSGNWLEDIAGCFDLIVSNPPYIPTGEISTLDPEVRLHDPHLALDGGPDGLRDYRIILAGAGAALAPGGRIFLEIGHDQAEAVTRIAIGHGFLPVAVHRDLGGQQRVVELRAGS